MACWRRKAHDLPDPATHSTTMPRVHMEQFPEVSFDSFMEEVENKVRKDAIGRQKAMTEIFIDRLVKEAGGLDEALLRVTSMINEQKLSYFAQTLVNRGANPLALDSDGLTPLYHAVDRNLRGVAKVLLENGEYLKATSEEEKMFIELLCMCLEKRRDDMSALLLTYIPKHLVRNQFESGGIEEFSLHYLLQPDLNMEKTILKVLDCMIESRDCDILRVYYSILESDADKRTPEDPSFDSSSKTPLQIIAKQGNKDIVYHDAVRLLVRRKWKTYVKKRLLLNAIAYVCALFCITFSAIVSVTVEDATVYNSPLQIARAVLEVVSLLMVFFMLCKEIIQLWRLRLEYFHEICNWFEFSSSVLLLTVPVLRFTHNNAEWYVFAFGYLLWTIVIYKFSFVTSQTRVYGQTLAHLLRYDFLQFGILFLVILLAFSVSFSLSLKGDGDLDKHVETSSFWGILFVGIRSLTEAAPAVEYTGPDGYAPVSMIIMLTFLFICIVVLLNILIAQLSDTFQRVQQDAHRWLEVDRARLVATFSNGGDNYQSFDDVQGVWYEMDNSISDIGDSLGKNTSICHFNDRMTQQEHILREICDRLVVQQELLQQLKDQELSKTK